MTRRNKSEPKNKPTFTNSSQWKPHLRGDYISIIQSTDFYFICLRPLSHKKKFKNVLHGIHDINLLVYANFQPLVNVYKTLSTLKTFDDTDEYVVFANFF